MVFDYIILTTLTVSRLLLLNARKKRSAHKMQALEEVVVAVVVAVGEVAVCLWVAVMHETSLEVVSTV